MNMRVKMDILGVKRDVGPKHAPPLRTNLKVFGCDTLALCLDQKTTSTFKKLGKFEGTILLGQRLDKHTSYIQCYHGFPNSQHSG